MLAQVFTSCPGSWVTTSAPLGLDAHDHRAQCRAVADVVPAAPRPPPGARRAARSGGTARRRRPRGDGQAGDPHGSSAVQSRRPRRRGGRLVAGRCSPVFMGHPQSRAWEGVAAPIMLVGLLYAVRRPAVGSASPQRGHVDQRCGPRPRSWPW
ncbi:hypothetical protein QJS66_15205 [Kocuria rhizophila]|nr:hypothetical protein QJS66_15205 [Kocuria rhizophila]